MKSGARRPILWSQHSTEGPRDVTWCRETARRYSVQWKIAQIEVVLRRRRRPIDHRALWTGVGTNRTRPAYTAARGAGEPTPNTLSVNSIFSIGFRQLYIVRHRTNMTSHAVVITMSKNEEYRYFSLSLSNVVPNSGL